MTQIDPAKNSIEFSGMQHDPNYLENTVIMLPGDISTTMSIKDYFKRMGVELDESDPYTYQLAQLLKSYFDNNYEKKRAERLFTKLQKNNSRMWKYIT